MANNHEVIRGNLLVNVLQKSQGVTTEDLKQQVHEAVHDMLSRRKLYDNPYQFYNVNRPFVLPKDIPPGALADAKVLKEKLPDVLQLRSFIDRLPWDPYNKWLLYELSKPISPLELYENNPELQATIFELVNLFPNTAEIERRFRAYEAAKRFTYDEEYVIVDILNTIALLVRRRKFWRNTFGGTRRHRNRKQTQRKLRK